MLNDLRHGLRVLYAAKGWTIVVVISLALGIGANTALFSAVNGLLLEKVSVHDPDSLVRLRYFGKNDMVMSSSDYGSSGNDLIRTTLSYPMFQQFVANNQTMTDLAAGAPSGRANVVVDGRADIATLFISSGNFYRLLGVTALRGRTIVPDDDQPSAPPVVTISASYWRSRFAEDPNIVGKQIVVSGAPVTVVGVLAPSFTGIQTALGTAPDVALPLALDPLVTTEKGRLTDPTYWWLQVIGRLKPGVTSAQVLANLDGLFQRQARAGLETVLAGLPESDRNSEMNQSRSQVPHLLVDSASHGIYDATANDRRSVTILSIVVALVLLTVCANVANLLLSRATSRQKEISIRLSMGATRARLIRQLLTESLLLAAMGGAMGVLVGYWGRQLLPGTFAQAPMVDWRVLSFALATTMLTGLLFGIAPALRATAMNLSAALKETSRSVVRSRSILSKLLLVVQVAVSLVLLVGAGLFLRTLDNLRHVDVGFNTDKLVLVRVNPLLNRYNEQRRMTLYQDMLDRLREVPGVRAVTLSQPGLLSGGVNSTNIRVEGRTYPTPRGPSINRLVVAANFFETMEMPLKLGRGFTEHDAENSPKVAILNEAAVRESFPNENPIGRHFGFSAENPRQYEIVGVLRDAKYNSVREPAPPTMYVPYTQAKPTQAFIAVRTATDPMSLVSSLRESVRRIDPDLPIMEVSTQIEQVERRIQQERFMAQAYTWFGGLALLVASIGLFGVMSYNVARRTNEIGIRMALGAQPAQVLQMIMGESMILVVIGVAIGVAAALAAARFIATLLFGLAPNDVVTVVVAVLVMLGVSALAGYLPARRASRVNPMVALHYE